ncbi:MAG: ribonuclease HII [Planctomycetota bacterium]|jgi:ribonuclease HII
MKNWIVGIDEVGRGPIAGPVTVGVMFAGPRAVALARKMGVRDSKALSPKKRAVWCELIQLWEKKGWCMYTTCSVSARVIDRIGIVYAIKLAMMRGLTRLGIHEHIQLFLDGGLRAPKKYIHQSTIIKGDTKIEAIAMASIVAKVTRDAYMVRQGKKYPQYLFGNHKGYGTKAHYGAIREHGPCDLHRMTWI